MPIITLTTDFGLDDAYAGVMKGVIASGSPDATLIDLTHAVLAQDVLGGAFVFETALPYFPPGTIHVVVVDPGVGGTRRRLAIEVNGHIFIGPDNGCLSAALPDASRGYREAGARYEARIAALPVGATAVSIESASVVSNDVSATFEGRDVFAPAAAYIANGGALLELGPPVDSMLAFPALRAPTDHGLLEGLVLHVDRFGNLITDIRGEDAGPAARFHALGRDLPFVRTYADAPGLCALVGSSGFVEVAMPNGSASLVLGAGLGDRVTARLA